MFAVRPVGQRPRAIDHCPVQWLHPELIWKSKTLLTWFNRPQITAIVDDLI
jgi:hypothetical protein